MLYNRTYWLNQVAGCKNESENFYVAPATITIYQKSYWTTLWETRYSVQVHVLSLNWGLFSFSSIVRDLIFITYELIVTPEMCSDKSTSGTLKFVSLVENFDVLIAFNKRKQSNFNSGVENKINRYCNKGQVKHCTLKTSMHRLKLTSNQGAEEVSNKNGRKVPSLPVEGGCETFFLAFFHTPGGIQKNVFWRKFKHIKQKR